MTYWLSGYKPYKINILKEKSVPKNNLEWRKGESEDISSIPKLKLEVEKEKAFHGRFMELNPSRQR